MKKKTYIVPVLQVYQIEPAKLLDGSTESLNWSPSDNPLPEEERFTDDSF